MKKPIFPNHTPILSDQKKLLDITTLFLSSFNNPEKQKNPSTLINEGEQRTKNTTDSFGKQQHQQKNENSVTEQHQPAISQNQPQ
ncbi:MAG: hypothetical protein EOO07_07525 [Chitinophagaceae bacterium]|nr:MAG: hypothetical protein EOO07_07525 [Chitinophagaceae bacterium]